MSEGENQNNKLKEGRSNIIICYTIKTSRCGGESQY